MTQEIRDRLASLEATTEERHINVSNTLDRIAVAVESIAVNQYKMDHLGAKVEKICAMASIDHDRLAVLETRQGVVWSVITIIGSAVVLSLVKIWGP